MSKRIESASQVFEPTLTQDGAAPKAAPLVRSWQAPAVEPGANPDDLMRQVAEYAARSPRHADVVAQVVHAVNAARMLRDKNGNRAGIVPQATIEQIATAACLDHAALPVPPAQGQA